MSAVDVAALGDLAMNSATKVSIEGQDIALVRCEEGVFALGNRCSHADVDLSEGEVERLKAASEAFYGGHRDAELPMHPPTLAYWREADGDVMRHNDYIHMESREIREILSKPLVGAVAAALAQTQSIRVLQATLIYKPGRADEATNLVSWHIDKHYWSTCSSDSLLTAFVPFHDCGVECVHEGRGHDHGCAQSQVVAWLKRDDENAADGNQCANPLAQRQFFV